jgi:hypothetical protein
MVRLLVTISLLGMLAGCGGGSDAAAGPAPTAVAVTGRVTFDLVPAVAGQGLDYAATVVRPARGVTVELLQNGAVAASTQTDVLGEYSFGSVPASTDVSLRVCLGLDGCRVHRDAFGGAVRDTRHRLRCRAADPLRGA